MQENDKEISKPSNKLSRLSIKNFTVFKEASFRFGSGLNVIVGENGSGKSHVMKLIYSVIASYAELSKKSHTQQPTKSLLQPKLGDKIYNVFRPDSLGRLATRKQGRERTEISLKFADDSFNCDFSFATQSKNEVTVDVLPENWQIDAPVFLPTRELLSIFPGFTSLYSDYHLSYEETYFDTCKLLGLPYAKGPRETRAKEIVNPLEKAIGGHIYLEKGGKNFYMKLNQDTGSGDMEINLVAEGWRKIGMLTQLVLNGAIKDKRYLFWDEPEANLNPMLIKIVAKTILALADKGIQIFITTHSLFLLRELEMLLNKRQYPRGKHRFFCLEITDGQVVIEQGRELADLSNIAVLDEELSQSDRYLED